VGKVHIRVIKKKEPRASKSGLESSHTWGGQGQTGTDLTKKKSHVVTENKGLKKTLGGGKELAGPWMEKGVFKKKGGLASGEQCCTHKDLGGAGVDR